jgi:hypothetical protein
LEESVAVREFGEDILEVEVYCVEGFCKGLQAQGGEVFDAEEEFVAFGGEGAEFVGTEFLFEDD